MRPGILSFFCSLSCLRLCLRVVEKEANARIDIVWSAKSGQEVLLVESCGKIFLDAALAIQEYTKTKPLLHGVFALIALLFPEIGYNKFNFEFLI
jgi:hypothetical protein